MPDSEETRLEIWRAQKDRSGHDGLIIGLTWVRNGLAYRTRILSNSHGVTHDNVMRSRFRDMATLMGDNVVVVDDSE